jgi:hypothetical protein
MVNLMTLDLRSFQMSHVRVAPFVLAFALMVSFLAAATNAATIGLNFAGSAGASQLASGDLAGVVHVGNWNNLTTVNGGASNLLNDSGTATTASVATENFHPLGAVQFSSTSTPGAGDGTMVNYSWFMRGSSSQDAVDISNIPYAQYDVYVYSYEDAVGRSTNFTIGATTLELTTIGHYSPFPPYHQATPADTSGNYVLFSGVTGSGFSLDIQGLSGGDSLFQSVLTGIQIVDVTSVPEPGSIVLLGVGLVGLLAGRRRIARRRAKSAAA